MAGTNLLKNSKNMGFSSTTIDEQEMLHFKKFAELWWDEFGKFKPLHSMNQIRIPWIRESLTTSKTIQDPVLPLKNFTILDVGCGGGILSEPLAKIGATLTGLDADEDMIKSAKTHAELNKIKVNYVVSSIEDHAKENIAKYDAVVASEVIEHVTKKDEFIEACVKCLKPGGLMFLTTFNKTWKSRFMGIFLGEYVLRLIPKGTHQYEKFIAPHELQRILERNNCRTEIIHGISYNILTNRWHWSSDSSCTYVLKAVKL